MTVAAEPSPFTSGDRQGYLLALSNISSRMNLAFKTLPPKCFTLPKPTSNFLLKSVRYSAAKLWNGLPNEVRAKQSLVAFKKGLKKVQI